MQGFPELTVSDVLRLLAGDFPDLLVESLRQLPGPETWVWVVNEELVFRFPRAGFRRRRARVDVEARVVAALRETSSGRAHVPPIEYVSPRGYSGQQLVRGVNGEERRPPREAWPALAADVRSVFAAVHGTPPPAGVELEPLPDAEELLERACADAPVAGVDALVLGSPPDVRGEPVLCHGDTKPEHFVLGPDDRLAWVLDWADACVAHPVRDLWGIVLWLGPEFARLVDPEHAATATFYARCSAVVNVARQVRGEWDAPPVCAQLREALRTERA